jgi:hypothetical protein
MLWCQGTGRNGNKGILLFSLDFLSFASYIFELLIRYGRIDQDVCKTSDGHLLPAHYTMSKISQETVLANLNFDDVARHQADLDHDESGSHDDHLKERDSESLAAVRDQENHEQHASTKAPIEQDDGVTRIEALCTSH